MKRTDLIHLLPIGTKEREAIERLRVHTVDEFLKADLSSIRHMSGCSMRTEEQVRQLREKCEQAVKHDEKFPDPCPDIDETIEMSNIQLNMREWRVLKHYSIQNVGDLLAFNPYLARGNAGVGNGTIERLLDMQKKICTQGTESLHFIGMQPSAPDADADAAKTSTTKAPDYSEVQTILDSLLTTYIPKERNRQIFRRRLGLDSKSGEKQPILEALGEEFGLTRERIRQICRDAHTRLRQVEPVEYLGRFWQAVDRHLEAHNSFHFIATLFKELKTEFDWRDSSRHQFIILLGLHPDLVVDADSGTVARNNCPCITCDEAQAFVAGILDTIPEPKKMDLSDVARALMEHCRNHCPSQRRPSNPYHPLFIRHIAAGIRSVDVLDGCLVTRYHWLLEHGDNVRELAYEILQDVGQPLHFRELAEIMRTTSKAQRLRTIQDNTVHGALVRSSRFACTDRGTYGLSTWSTKRYVSHGKAIIRLLEQTGRPMTAQEIIDKLTRSGDFHAPNIRAALRGHSRIKTAARGLYSLAD